MTLPFTLPEREGGALAVGEFAPGAGFVLENNLLKLIDIAFQGGYYRAA